MGPTTHIVLGILVGILGGALVAIGGAWVNHGFNLRQEQKTPSTGKMSGKVLDGGKTYILNLGNNPLRILGSTLSKGINLGDLLSQLFGKINAPIKIYEENNRILIDTTVYDEKNQTVCQIVANEWQFNPNGEYDRNYSINAFEIINGKGIPILQLYLSDNQIFIGGYFYAENGDKLILTPEQLIYITPDRQGLDENNLPKRLFQYPSSDHLGQLIKDNLPRPNPIDRDQEKAIEEAETANSKLTNAELKKKSSELIGQIKNFLAPHLEAYDKLEAQRYSQSPNSPEHRKQFENNLEKSKAEIEARVLPEYYARFHTQTVLLRREMLSRLPEDQRMKPDFYGHSQPNDLWMLTNWIGLMIKLTEAMPSPENEKSLKRGSGNDNSIAEQPSILRAHARKNKKQTKRSARKPKKSR
jgi:hypothetical protein